MLLLLWAGSALLLAPSAAASDTGDQPAPETGQIHGFAGQPLAPSPLTDETRQRFEENLQAAKQAYQADPSADKLIWLGRRNAYLGRYPEAIEIFSRGVDEFPEDPRFLRHRGHRYISTRQLDLAIADFTRAVQLIAGRADQIEPDGLPNARNTPTSTLHSNIWYHLGLAHYLSGDFEAARQAYEAGVRVSTNPDMVSAMRYWLYLTQRRLGLVVQANTNLAAVGRRWDIIENQTYYRLLLLFRDDLDAEDLLGGSEDALQNATLAYGLAAYSRLGGQIAQAERILDELLASEQRFAFAYIAAEADRYREGR